MAGSAVTGLVLASRGGGQWECQGRGVSTPVDPKRAWLKLFNGARAVPGVSAILTGPSRDPRGSTASRAERWVRDRLLPSDRPSERRDCSAKTSLALPGRATQTPAQPPRGSRTWPRTPRKCHAGVFHSSLAVGALWSNLGQLPDSCPCSLGRRRQKSVTKDSLVRKLRARLRVSKTSVRCTLSNPLPSPLPVPHADSFTIPEQLFDATPGR